MKQALHDDMLDQAEAIKLHADLLEESAKKLRLKAAGLEVLARQVEHLIAESKALREKEAGRVVVGKDTLNKIRS